MCHIFELQKKRLESNFKELLKTKLNSLNEQSKWEDVRKQIEHDDAYVALASEVDCLRLFEEYHRQCLIDCQRSHDHKRTSKEKKKRKQEKIHSSQVTANINLQKFSFGFILFRNLKMS